MPSAAGSAARAASVHIGVGPFPDELLDGAVVAGPEARFDAHESISLAFLTALQLLPPRQRAVLSCAMSSAGTRPRSRRCST